MQKNIGTTSSQGNAEIQLSPKHQEASDVTDNGTYLDLSSQLSWIDALGSMEGLLSTDLNPDAWRLTDAALLADPVSEPTSLAILSVAMGLIAPAMVRRGLLHMRT